MKYAVQPEEHAELPENLATALFVQAFGFAQGHTTLPVDIYEFMHATNPDWRISPRVRAQLFANAPIAVRERFSKSPHVGISDKDIRDMCEQYIDKMYKTLSADNIPDMNSVTATLAEGFIDRDHHYLCELGNRPAKPKSPQQFETDRYASYVCHYGFLQHLTGVRVFDEMFRAVRRHIIQTVEQRQPWESLEKLRAVVQVHNAHHEQYIALDTSKMACRNYSG